MQKLKPFAALPVATLFLAGYGYLSLRIGTDLGGRDVNCVDARSLSPGGAINIGAVSRGKYSSTVAWASKRVPMVTTWRT